MDLRTHGLVNLGPVHAQLSPAQLVEIALARKEGTLASNGAFVANTVPFTGRAAKDKYLVRRPGNETQIAWGAVNQPMDPVNFDRLWERAKVYFQQREVFVHDGWACADPTYRVGVRVITENAWHAMFIQCLLRVPTADECAAFTPNLVIFHVPSMKLESTRYQTRTD